MSVHPDDEDRRWTREKRDCVADAREETADQREVVADARDAVADVRDLAADVRESHLDEWEQQLAMRAAAWGLAFGPLHGASPWQEEDESRVRAREERGVANLRRGREKRERDEAAQRRVADERPTLLAVAFAEIAERCTTRKPTRRCLIRRSTT